MVFKLNQIIGKVELEIGEARSQFEINVTRPPQLYIETNRVLLILSIFNDY